MHSNPIRRLTWAGALLPLLALGVSACDDETSTSPDPCAGLAGCATAGGTTCQGNTVQTCTANADGCLVWTDTETCGADRQCSGGACVCADECAGGESQCSGNVVQLCTADSAGCWSFADDTDCAANGEICDDTAGAQCVPTGGCGDNTVTGTEVCDGTDLGGQDCTDQGFYGGTLACNGTCDGFDTSGCAGSCGDDTLDAPTEVCDGADLGTEDCVSQGFDGGTLACNGTCDGFDVSGCSFTAGTVCPAPIDVTGQTFPYTATGTFDDDPADGFSCGPTPTNVVWFSYTAPTTGTYIFSAGNGTTTSAWSRLVVLDGTACSPYDGELVCSTADSTSISASADLVSGSTYLIAFFTDGDAYTMVDPEITIEPAPPGYLCSNAVDISSVAFPYQLTGTFEDDDSVTGFSCGSPATNVVWYHYTAATTGLHVIQASNSSTTGPWSRLVVLGGTACAPYAAELVCDTSNSGSITTGVTLTAGTTYLIAFFTDDYQYTMVDPEITISTAVPVGWCNVQSPATITAEEGQPQVIYGRVYVAGVTDQSPGIDPHPLVVAQAGVGPDGADPTVDPTQLIWNAAQPNMGYGNNDEYMATIIVPPAGASYDYAYRFSGDGGASWTYCDRTDSTYNVADAGAMTPVATTVTALPSAFGAVIITEVTPDPAVLPDAGGEWFELYNPTATDWNLNSCVLTDLGTNTHTIAGHLIVPAGGYSTSANSANPGFTPGYVHSSFTLANTDDEIYLTCGGVLIDNVDYDGGIVWPDPTGASMSLDPASLDPTANNDGANWCVGSEPYNGDLGSPNRANPTCP